MDGIRAHYGGTATAGCLSGVVFCRRASMRRDDDENMGDDRRRRDDDDGFEVRVCACVVMREPCGGVRVMRRGGGGGGCARGGWIDWTMC